MPFSSTRNGLTWPDRWSRQTPPSSPRLAIRNVPSEAIAMPLLDSYDVILCETSPGCVFDWE